MFAFPWSDPTANDLKSVPGDVVAMAAKVVGVPPSHGTDLQDRLRAIAELNRVLHVTVRCCTHGN